MLKDDAARAHRDLTWRQGITIKAWNYYRDGKTVSNLRYAPGGSISEEMQEPR